MNKPLPWYLILSLYSSSASKLSSKSHVHFSDNSASVLYNSIQHTTEVVYSQNPLLFWNHRVTWSVFLISGISSIMIIIHKEGNCMYLLLSKNRSGLNSRGFVQYWGSLCIMQIPRHTWVPAGTSYPPRQTSCLQLRKTVTAGGWSRNDSFITLPRYFNFSNFPHVRFSPSLISRSVSSLIFSCISGCLDNSCSVQDIETLVVSWPAEKVDWRLDNTGQIRSTRGAVTKQQTMMKKESYIARGDSHI